MGEDRGIIQQFYIVQPKRMGVSFFNAMELKKRGSENKKSCYWGICNKLARLDFVYL